MYKKLIAAFAAMAVFGALAALPSGASAAPCVTDPAGTCLVPPKTLLLTEHSNQVLTTPNGIVTCTKAKITGDLEKNDRTNGIQATITTAEFTGTATSSRCATTISDGFGGNATVKVTQVGDYCLTSVGSDTASVTQGACGSAATGPKFIFDVFTAGGFSLGECEYERQTAAGGVAALTATYNTNIAPATGTYEASQIFKRIKGSALVCPSEGTLSGQFTLFTDNPEETPVSIS
jgi:hypothetical protein